ncbi:carbon-nitrogen hydrolase family protein [Nocardia jejuensis]|uniref:carbon-nitrogen hydrolase family protein n=1 Tax=Nocardia jejuensis TaxID=328049 RepID=UPI00082F1941|nr:carbon-nitrogen hydrolase family protein [Nocardia jejuensis]
MRAPLTVTAAQLTCIPGDIEKNVARHVSLLADIAETGSRVVVFTELSLTGYELPLLAADLANYAVLPDDPRLEPLRAACAAYSMFAVVGAVVAVPGGHAIASLVFDDSGTPIAVYTKHHLHGVEAEMFVAGTEFTVVEVDGTRLGLAVCADVNDPGHAAATVAAGAQVYVASALYLAGKEGRRDGHMVSRSVENGCWTVLSAYSTPVDGVPATGGSGVWRPDGSLVAQIGPESPGFVTAVLSV